MNAERPLARNFFRGTTVDVAKRLLGVVIVHTSPAGRTAGRIVETEAYLARGDAASHSHRGRTPRNASMFLAPGHAYVYRIYGIHLCVNVVSAADGVGEAVLLRALEPLEGLELMAARRGRSGARELCSGPAKLVQAMGIELAQDGCELSSGALRLVRPETGWRVGSIAATPRVGVTRAARRRLRFHPRGSPWVPARFGLGPPSA